MRFDAEPLTNALLKRWVLERSGNASTPGRGVNETSFDSAKKRLSDAKVLRLRDGEIQERLLFLHQARHVLTDARVDPEPAIGSLRAYALDALSTPAFAGVPDLESRGLKRKFVAHMKKWKHVVEQPRLEGPRSRLSTSTGDTSPVPYTIRVELDYTKGTIFLDHIDSENSYGRHYEWEP